MGLFKEDRTLKLPLSRNFDPKEDEYDAVIIGAGMSGMAAAIRLAMFDKKVLLLERHTISGGLNSYYNRRKRALDVGLHALTNFAEKGEKRKPLTKLLKQLRIPYSDLELTPQKESMVAFPGLKLNFSNDIESLKKEIKEHFPDQIEGFKKLLAFIEEYNEVSLDNETFMAKDVVDRYITNKTLREMIFCPLLIYGSAWENDMDFSQFVIMFKSIFLEGFARSKGGVRRILELLHTKLETSGAEVCFRNGVKEIKTREGRVYGLETTRGQMIKTNLILSCAGLPETYSLISCNEKVSLPEPRVGKLSFVETILTGPKRPHDYGLEHTIIFHNEREDYLYQKPNTLVDEKSAVLCFPNNFQDDDYEEGVYRITMMANYDLWQELSQAKEKEKEKAAYNKEKEKVRLQSIAILKQYMPELTEDDFEFSDVFTPTTVKHYTGHFGGCVYGSPDKSRDGSTPIKGLAIIGTDQGFLGIVGSMLSGISMANLYGFMQPTPTETQPQQESTL